MRILKGTVEIAAGEVARPQSEIVIGDIPAGEYVIAVDAYGVDFAATAPPVPVASQKAFIPVVIKAGLTTPTKIELESTVDYIEVMRSNFSMGGSGSGTLETQTSFALDQDTILYATAYNKDNAAVPLSEGNMIFEVSGGLEKAYSTSDVGTRAVLAIRANTLEGGTIRASVSERETGAKKVSFVATYTIDRPEYIERSRVASLPSRDITSGNQSFVSAVATRYAVAFGNGTAGISSDGLQTTYAGLRLFDSDNALISSYDYPGSTTGLANVALRGMVLFPRTPNGTDPFTIVVLKSDLSLPEGSAEREKLQFFGQSSANRAELTLLREADGTGYIGFSRNSSNGYIAHAFRSSGEIEQLYADSVSPVFIGRFPSSLQSAHAFAEGISSGGAVFYAATQNRVVRFDLNGIDTSFNLPLPIQGKFLMEVYRGLIYVVPVGGDSIVRVYNSKGDPVNEIDLAFGGNVPQPLAVSVGLTGLSLPTPEWESLIVVDDFDPSGESGAVINRFIRTR